MHCATTAGGVLIDLFSGVTPEIVKPCEHILTTAVLASAVYAGIAVLGRENANFFPVTLLAVSVAFLFHVLAVKDHWPQIVPKDAPAEGPGGASDLPSTAFVRELHLNDTDRWALDLWISCT
jgi:hypothetical protein